MEYGVTSQGFKRKTLEEIIEAMENRAKSLFGVDIDMSDTSPDGMFLKNTAYELAELWKEAEDIYYSAFKDTSEGINLDYVGKYIGIKRKSAQKAIVELFFQGLAGTVIPVEFKVETGGEDSKVFITDEPITIETNGTVTVNASAEKPGSSYNVPANTITKITNPIPGVNTVTNPEEAKEGKDYESDIEFRDRYERSLAQGGSSTAVAIQAEILSLDGVEDCIVEENESNITVNDIPPKSIAPLVVGGNDQEIAKAILDVKPAGIQSFGSTSVTVQDSRGFEYQIGFNRPIQVYIYVNVVLTTDSNFPTDGNEKVRTEVIKYIGGIDSDITYNGLGLGYDVIWSKIIAAIQSNINGITDLSVELSADNLTFNSSNISIDTRGIAVTDFNKVVVS